MNTIYVIIHDSVKQDKFDVLCELKANQYALEYFGFCKIFFFSLHLGPVVPASPKSTPPAIPEGEGASWLPCEPPERAAGVEEARTPTFVRFLMRTLTWPLCHLCTNPDSYLVPVYKLLFDSCSVPGHVIEILLTFKKLIHQRRRPF